MVGEGEKHDDGGVFLPEDIVFDVLTCLPAKDLCRFRCVCKGWRALISDPAFVAAQRSHACPYVVAVPLGPHLLPEVRVMDMDGNLVRKFEITRSTPLPPQLPTRLDLICAEGTGLTRDGGMIIDPAAGRAFAAFDTAHQPPWAMTYLYSTSFGRATPSGVFKVLRLLNQQLLMDDDHGDANHQLCEVASIMDGSGGGTAEPLTWRRKSLPPYFTWSIYNVVVNGVVYFITNEVEIDGDVDEDDEDDDAAPSLYRIVAFDLQSEEWTETINAPALGHYKEEERWSVSLVELNGTLAFVHELVVDTYPYMSIWLLIDPDKVWLMECMIQLPKNQMGSAKPLGVLVDGRILLLLSSLSPFREVVLFYDYSTKAFTEFMEMAEEFRFTFVFYTGSLLS